MSKMVIDKTEMYPVYVLYGNTYSSGRIVEVPEDILEEYNEMFMKFDKMQDKIENLYNEVKNI